MRIIFKSLKTQLIIFLLAFAVYLAIKDADQRFALSLIAATAAALLSEGLVLLLKTKKFLFAESAVVTGMITAFLIDSGEPPYKIAGAAALAIASKHLLRFKGRHIFNPAAFGILAVVLVLHVSTQWKGTYLWYILVPAGLYFSWRIRKLGLLAGYFSLALALFGIQALVQKAPLADIFGYLSYFFIFIMLVEPKTTPVKNLGKIIFGAGAAILIFILTQINARFDVELAALLTFNAFTPSLNRLELKRP